MSHLSKIKYFTQFLFCFLIVFSTKNAFGQFVEKINGAKALINMESESFSVGSEVYALNNSGKKSALLKIKQVKGQKAVAEVIKGTATQGMKISSKGGSAGKSANADSPPQESEQAPSKRKNGQGFLLAFSMDSMALQAADNQTPTVYTENVSLAGSSFKIKYFYDYAWKNPFVIRMAAGLDGFNGAYRSSSIVINNNASRNSSIAVNYISFDISLNWNFHNKPKTQIWGAGGYSLQLLSSAASTLHSLQISGSMSNVIFFGVGADIWRANFKSYIPIYFYYNLYLFGTGITASSLNFGTGWGWAK